MMKRLVVLAVIVLLFALLSTLDAAAQKRMKVYISVDMEGVAGVVTNDQCKAGGDGYERARLWMTQEANAAIQGALDAGATEILVNDSHGSMLNLLPDELNPAARLISGHSKDMSMVERIDATYDAAIFIGYHARIGSSDAVLDDTYSGTIYSVRINGMEVGESEINAIVAGQFGVPVVMISGDNTLCNQVKNLLGNNIVTVDVKDGIGRKAANTLVPSESQKKIREGAAIALKKVKEIKPFKPEGPYIFEIDFIQTTQADLADLIPGVERIRPRSVKYTQTNFIDGFRLFWAIVLLTKNS